MPLDLLKRVEKSSPITAAEHDDNFTSIEQQVNATQTSVTNAIATAAADATAKANAAQAAAISAASADATNKANTAQSTAVSLAAADATAKANAAQAAAALDATSKANAVQALCDDVLEFANLAAFPTTGESGKLYVATDNGNLYRWAGSSYSQVATGNSSSVTVQSLTASGNIAAWGSMVRVSSSAAVSLTLPYANAQDIGKTITVRNGNEGMVTITEGTNTTFNYQPGQNTLRFFEIVIYQVTMVGTVETVGYTKAYDATVTSGSPNAVTSGAVFNALSSLPSGGGGTDFLTVQVFS